MRQIELEQQSVPRRIDEVSQCLVNQSPQLESYLLISYMQKMAQIKSMILNVDHAWFTSDILNIALYGTYNKLSYNIYMLHHNQQQICTHLIHTAKVPMLIAGGFLSRLGW